MTKPSTHETKEPGALFPKSQKKDLCAIRGAATKLHLDPCRGRAWESKKCSKISWQSYKFTCKILIFLGCVIGDIKITHRTYSLFTSASMQHTNWLSTFISIFSWFILNVGGCETIIWTKFWLSLFMVRIVQQKDTQADHQQVFLFFVKRIIFSRYNWLAHFWLDFNIKVELRTNEARSTVVVIFIASIKNVIIAKSTSHCPNSKSQSKSSPSIKDWMNIV